MNKENDKSNLDEKKIVSYSFEDENGNFNEVYGFLIQTSGSKKTHEESVKEIKDMLDKSRKR